MVELDISTSHTLVMVHVHLLKQHVNSEPGMSGHLGLFVIPEILTKGFYLSVAMVTECANIHAGRTHYQGMAQPHLVASYHAMHRSERDEIDFTYS